MTLRLMLRPAFTVARPRDWLGVVANLGCIVGIVLAVVPLLLIRLPASWVALALGQGWLVRALLIIAVAWLLGNARGWILARLPRASYAVRSSLIYVDGERRRRVELSAVVALYVELRDVEMFMFELDDGSVHGLCPVDWPGAGALYQRLARAIWRR